LLVLSSGRVRVEKVEQAAAANLMATVDVAFNMADAEPPPIPPSMPVELGSIPPPAEPALRAPRLPTDTFPELPQPAPISSSAAVNAAIVPPPLDRDDVTFTETPRDIPGDLVPPPAAAMSAIYAEPAATEWLAPPSHAALTDSDAGEPATRTGLVAAMAGVALLVVLVGVGIAWRLYSRDQESSPVPDAAPVESAAAPLALPSPAPIPSEEPSTTPTTLDAGGGLALPVLGLDPRPAPSCENLLGAQKRKDSVGEQIRAARRELMRGDIDAAQREYCAAIRTDPKNTVALTELARLLLVLQGDPKYAAEIAKRASGQDPTRASQLLLGDAMAAQGDYDAALDEWLRTIGLTRSDAAAREARARRESANAEKHLRAQGLGNALRLYLRAAVFDPDNPEASAGVARSLLRMGKPISALAWASRARELAPKNAGVRVALGDVLKANGDAAAAKAEWYEALAVDPTNKEATRRLQKSGK
jgi:tetratricopeptide (TPR) repeat protein